MTEGICPFCKSKVETNPLGPLNQGYSVDCPVCEKFEISNILFEDIRDGDLPADPLMSAWIRNRNEEEITIPLLKTEDVEIIKKGTHHYSVDGKIYSLLKVICKRSSFPGERIQLNIHQDYPLAWASNPEEMLYLFNSLESLDLTEDAGSAINGVIRCKVTPRGWQEYHNESNPFLSRQGFVAMDFDDSMKHVFEDGIKPAIESAGYDAHRIGWEPHNENIVFKIISEIKRSKFVVCDLTNQKNGAYFEAGYAMGMGIPVIYSIQEDDAENAHFDLKQYNQIRWKDANDLKEQLYNFICAIIGERKKD